MPRLSTPASAVVSPIFQSGRLLTVMCCDGLMWSSFEVGSITVTLAFVFSNMNLVLACALPLDEMALALASIISLEVFALSRFSASSLYPCKMVPCNSVMLASSCLSIFDRSRASRASSSR